MTKRTQGRPPRASGMNGREKLIEATRAYLQSNRKMSLTRSEIAQGCGVTPALISYYFKDKRSLIEAAIKPLLEAYSSKLQAIAGADSPLDARLRATIRLLIELNADNAFLVDYMLGGLEAAKLGPDDRETLDRAHGATGGLITELIAGGHWRPSNPGLTEIALWGMCRAFGESVRLQSAAPDDARRRAELLHDAVAFVCDAFSVESMPPLVPSLAATTA